RGAVVRVGGEGADGAHRGQVHDAAAGGAAEVGYRLAADAEGGGEVGGQHVVPLLVGDGVEVGGLIAADIIDQHVEAPERGDGGGDEGRGGFGVAQVGGEGVDAGVGQGEGDGAPDAAGGAGDEGGLALQGAGNRHVAMLPRVRGRNAGWRRP